MENWVAKTMHVIWGCTWAWSMEHAAVITSSFLTINQQSPGSLASVSMPNGQGLTFSYLLLFWITCKIQLLARVIYATCHPAVILWRGHLTSLRQAGIRQVTMFWNKHTVNFQYQKFHMVGYRKNIPSNTFSSRLAYFTVTSGVEQHHYHAVTCSLFSTVNNFWIASVNFLLKVYGAIYV